MSIFNARKQRCTNKFKRIDEKLDNDFQTQKKTQTQINTLTRAVVELQKISQAAVDGIMLGLENDRVVFNALRSNHINGESELQERKMDGYFMKCAKEGLNCNSLEKEE